MPVVLFGSYPFDYSSLDKISLIVTALTKIEQKVVVGYAFLENLIIIIFVQNHPAG